MTDQDAKIDDVPAGFTLITPGAPSAPPGAPSAPPGGSGIPQGFTDVTPGPKASGSGVLQNPGGDLPGGPAGGPASGPAGGPAGGPGPIPPTPPPERSASDFVLNQIPESAGRFVMGTLGAVRHPVDTVEGLAKLASGGVQAAARAAGVDIPENEYDQVAQAFGHYVSNRYGSVDKAKEALYTDPVGVMSDFSLVVGGAGGVAELAKAGEVAKVLGTVSRVTNPAFLPGKAVSLPVKYFAPKVAKAAAFDPRTATFDNDALPGDFDPRTATFEPPARYSPPVTPKPAPPPPQPDLQGAIQQRAYDLAKQRQGEGVVPGRAEWLQAEQDIRNKPPKAPEAETPEAPPAAAQPAPAVNSTADAATSRIRQYVKTGLGVAGLSYGLDLLTHHLTQSIVGGALIGGAVKAIPELLRTQAGQQMLARIGPGSTPAQVAAVARDMVPALNAAYRASHAEEQPISLADSPYAHARGGPVNHELARIQNERLDLRGGTIRALQRN